MRIKRNGVFISLIVVWNTLDFVSEFYSPTECGGIKNSPLLVSNILWISALHIDFHSSKAERWTSLS